MRSFHINGLVPSELVRALGGGIWRAVLGDWDRSREGGEQAMLVHRIIVHPNFTDYQDDIGKDSHVSLRCFSFDISLVFLYNQQYAKKKPIQERNSGSVMCHIFLLSESESKKMRHITMATKKSSMFKTVRNVLTN